MFQKFLKPKPGPDAKADDVDPTAVERPDVAGVLDAAEAALEKANREEQAARRLEAELRRTGCGC